MTRRSLTGSFFSPKLCFFLLFHSPCSPVVPSHNPLAVDKLESGKQFWASSLSSWDFIWTPFPRPQSTTDF